MQKQQMKNSAVTVIIVAALLLELTAAGMYYTSQHIIQNTMERLVKTEMNALYLCIRNKLAAVEVAVDNMAWMVNENIDNPDDMFDLTSRLVENNPSILGSSISFVPDYYSKKGHWFEPYAARRIDGSVESMQLGSADHDYTRMAFYSVPVTTRSSYWCEPYRDSDGARAVVTTYSTPVCDVRGQVVAVADADISLEWLEEIVAEGKQYESTRRYLVTASNQLLAGVDDALFQTALASANADDDRQGYITTRDEKGEKVHVFFQPVGGKTDWQLISVLYDREVFGRLLIVRLILLGLVIVGLLIAVYIVWRSSREAEKLRRVNEEKARIDTELRVASEIQQSMLPRQDLQTERVELRGYLKPAREVGGDLYDYYVRDEKLFFCIGDVSGKGAASAMLMAVTHSLFRSASAHETHPAHIMCTINEALAKNNEKNMFVTLFIGVLDLPTGHLRYCNAGHDKPIVIQPATSDIQYLNCDANLPLGVFEDTPYTQQETTLKADSGLFLYTDGLTEAKDIRRQQFGLERVVEMLEMQGERIREPQVLLDSMIRAVHAFVGDAEQSDDLTMLAIYCKSAQFDSVLTRTMTLTNAIREIKRVNAFSKEVAEQLHLDSKQAGQLQLAVEEAVVNVIEYAYPAGSEGQIDIQAQSDGKTLRVQITDNGVPFDPTTKEKADVTLSAEERQLGGLGILLVREMMDSINYERMDGKNVLTLVKTLNGKN